MIFCHKHSIPCVNGEEISTNCDCGCIEMLLYVFTVTVNPQLFVIPEILRCLIDDSLTGCLSWNWQQPTNDCMDRRPALCSLPSHLSHLQAIAFNNQGNKIIIRISSVLCSLTVRGGKKQTSQQEPKNHACTHNAWSAALNLLNWTEVSV